MRAARRLALLLALAPACAPVSCERAAEPAAAPPPAAPRADWPRAVVPDLAEATPATLVTVEPERVQVSNRGLIATWPAFVLERARAGRPEDEPDWPVVEAGGELDALPELLSRARRAERAGSEAGSGAGAFHLRVASDVPFARVERALHLAAQAGYAEPRLLLSAGETDRVLPWPSAPPRPAPSREEIEAALHGAPLEEPAASEPRARLDAARVTTSACELEGALDVSALTRCARALRAAGDTIVLEIDPETPFERVAIALQALTRAFAHVRTTSR